MLSDLSNISVDSRVECVRVLFFLKWDQWSLFNEGGIQPTYLLQPLKKISSISPKMAADVGSMFQYWKKFDLRRLQVSAILTFLGLFSQRYVSSTCPAACRLVFGANEPRKPALLALIVIRNWSCSAFVQFNHWSAVEGPRSSSSSRAAAPCVLASPIWDQHRGQHCCSTRWLPSCFLPSPLRGPPAAPPLTRTETF